VSALNSKYADQMVNFNTMTEVFLSQAGLIKALAERGQENGSRTSP
jgi:hypothetical protein